MNMDYCKFENTSRALQQCVDDWVEKDVELNEYESRGKERIIDLARTIVGWEG